MWGKTGKALNPLANNDKLYKSPGVISLLSQQHVGLSENMVPLNPLRTHHFPHVFVAIQKGYPIFRQNHVDTKGLVHHLGCFLKWRYLGYFQIIHVSWDFPWNKPNKFWRNPIQVSKWKLDEQVLIFSQILLKIWMNMFFFFFLKSY